MPTSFRILPERGLVYVRYEGYVRLDEVERNFAAYLENPQAHPGQKHLIDLARTTGYETDYARLMSIQADRTDTYLSHDHQIFMTIFAPTPVALRFGRVLVAPWIGLERMIVSLQQDEAAVMTILGQPETSIAHMMRSAA